MKTYLFNIATGYMTLANAKPKHIRTETTGERPNRVTTALDEIRSSALEYDSKTHTLQIVDDVVTVVVRPSRPVVVPVSITPRQLRLALTESGDRVAVEAVVAGADSDVQDSWQFAQSFQQDDPTMQAMIAVLSWDQDKVNTLFVLAGTKPR